MMYIKKCECCGKKFLSKSNLKKYCSKSCKSEARKRKQEENEQLCWRCKNACGGCDWSKHLKPIGGWIAELITIKDSMGDFSSYKIHKCPEFISDK